MMVLTTLNTLSTTRLSFYNKFKLSLIYNFSSSSNESTFRVINLRSVKSRVNLPRKQTRKLESVLPRTHEMLADQNWGNVWPGPKSFHPATVPLPLRQGYSKKDAPPSKYGNAELMKIPNFLHLTPPVIKRQCDLLAKFCTPWPTELPDEESCSREFPIETYTSTYCFSSPSIRNPLARIVTLRIKLSSLSLDQHARDKLLRLVGDRYDESSDIITIVADRCPTKSQNFDYCFYLLTAIFHESWNFESWESKKTEEDMEYYDWNKSRSFDNIKKMFGDSLDSSFSNDFAKAVSNLMNKGESLELVKNYSDTVRKLLNLPGQM